jgi:adenylate cyclase class 2
VREVEVKYRIQDSEALLAALKTRGLELGAPVAQDDQAYAPGGWSYGDDRQGVPFARLRTTGGRHVFTVKRPAENLLSCAEHETEVADRDQMHGAIMAMGFRPTVRIVKVRRTAACRDMLLCVDELDGLGWFLEVERMVPGDEPGEVVQAELCRFVESLGVAAERTEQTYDWLVRQAGVSAALVTVSRARPPAAPWQDVRHAIRGPGKDIFDRR